MRGGITAVDKNRRRKLKEVQHVVTLGLYHSTERIKLSRTVCSAARAHSLAGKYTVKNMNSQRCTAVFYPPVGPLSGDHSDVKVILTHSMNVMTARQLCILQDILCSTKTHSSLAGMSSVCVRVSENCPCLHVCVYCHSERSNKKE